MATTTTENLRQRIQQQKIIIQNSCGENLVGLLHETGSKEIVILCHGFRDSKDYIMMVEFSLAFEKQGISSFRFDFSGNGESEGIFQFGNYHKEVNDLKAVIQHFTAVNRLITAILGHSKGGTVVLLYASLYHDIQTIVNVSGRYNMDSGLEGRLGKNYIERARTDGFIDIRSKKGKVLYRVTEESLMEWMNTNMYEACLKLDQNCRVLTVYGSVDEVIPVEDALEFAKIIPNHELRIIEGANHGYSNYRGAKSLISNHISNPAAQKDVIEQMNRDLLDSGVIRGSTSPFAAPVVLVKKKDGAWRLCIDYTR